MSTDPETKQAVLDRLAFASALMERGFTRAAWQCLNEAIDLWAGRVKA